MLIPRSWFIPSAHVSLLVTIHLFSKSVSLFLFCKYIHLYHFFFFFCNWFCQSLVTKINKWPRMVIMNASLVRPSVLSGKALGWDLLQPLRTPRLVLSHHSCFLGFSYHQSLWTLFSESFLNECHTKNSTFENHNKNLLRPRSTVLRLLVKSVHCKRLQCKYVDTCTW